MSTTETTMKTLIMPTVLPTSVKNPVFTIAKSSLMFSGLVMASILFASISRAQEAEKVEKVDKKSGILFAAPANIASDISLEEYRFVVSYFNDPKNKVRIQFPGDESRYAWQTMSLFFRTAQVQRSGAISDLPYKIQYPVGSITYRNGEGETYSVDAHFDKFPIDGMIVVKNGAVVYERYKTMFRRFRRFCHTVENASDRASRCGARRTQAAQIRWCHNAI